jgi:hypothetical protein
MGHPAVSMLNFDLPSVSAPPGRTPRVVAVVDGGDCAWRSLAWAVGYAAARGSTRIEIVPFVRSWERLCSAGQLNAYATSLPPIDHSAARRAISETAKNICLDGGIEAHIVKGNVSTSSDLRVLLRQGRPDFVVISRAGALSWITARRTVSSLTRSGIPVIVIP